MSSTTTSSVRPATRSTRPSPAGALAPWSVAAVAELLDLPFADLLFRAQEVHRAHHGRNAVQLSTLLSIKTGGCPEDCGYCPQAARYHTGGRERGDARCRRRWSPRRAPPRRAGATRFCMGAAWRGPKQRDLEPVLDMVREVKALGLETCATLGMLKDGQAEQLRDAGLDYYNHNLDTAPEFYGEIISTRDVRRSPRHARPRARCRPARVLRRHRRHGRIAAAARGPDRAARQPGPVSGVGADQPSGAGRRHAAARAIRWRTALDPFEFVRTIAVRAHHDAEGHGAPVGRTPGDRRRHPGAVLPRRRELDLLRREAAHHRQSGRRRRSRAVRAARPVERADARPPRDVDRAPDRGARRADLARAATLPDSTACPARRWPVGAARPACASIDGARCSRFAATTISASRAILRSSPPRAQGARRWGVGAGASHLVCGHTGAARRARARARRVRGALPRRARADVFHRLSRQPRDPDDARRARRRDLRRPAQSRLPQRRRAAVARAAHPLCARRRDGARARACPQSRRRASSSPPTRCSAWTATSRRCRDCSNSRSARRVARGRRRARLRRAGRGPRERSRTSASRRTRIVYMGTLGKAAGRRRRFRRRAPGGRSRRSCSARGLHLHDGRPADAGRGAARGARAHPRRRRAARERLRRSIARFRAGAARLAVAAAAVRRRAIQPLVVGGSERAVALSRTPCANAGFSCPRSGRRRCPRARRGCASRCPPRTRRRRRRAGRRAARSMTVQTTLASMHVESLGRGPPLVLLHGWALHGGLFAPIAAGARRAAIALHVRRPPRPRPLRRRWHPATLDAMVDALAGAVAATSRADACSAGRSAGRWR